MTETASKNWNMWWKGFIAFLTIAVVATIGGLVGYYVINQPPEERGDIYYVGIAREDVTGPVVQVNMMGYAHLEQIAKGLHTRLYSKAFVIADATQENRIAFVSFDGGMTSQLIKLEVVKRLQERYGKLFSEKNVVISGTHTHSGPAGFFQYLLFEVTSFGHIQQSTDTFIEGITKSIIRANENMVKSYIKMGRANVDTGNINRSPTSYLRNPEEERAMYNGDTDQEMTVLRFDTVEGEAIGMISWYPVHPTSMNFTNRLVSSDNKGRASMLFEEAMRKEGETATGKETFIAAFAQSNLGDVSPRTNGPICVDTGDECEPYTSSCNNRSQGCIGFGPGKDHFESTDIIAKRQVEAAFKAYKNAQDNIRGPITWVHQYVDMAKGNATLSNGSKVESCKPGMGYSFASGTTDGAGILGFLQGTTETSNFWVVIREIICLFVCSEKLTDEYLECHKPKPVLLPTGYMDRPYEWHPTIIDVQILRIGQLILPAVPGEYTTMAGRRLRRGLRNIVMNNTNSSIDHIVVSGLSNVYTHYISTPEEYTAQRYESASVIFGINTFSIYQEKFEKLLKAMLLEQQDLLETGPLPQIKPPNSSRFVADPGPDKLSPGMEFGDVIKDVEPVYAAGETVSVVFQGANPRHNMKLGGSYLEIQRIADEEWETLFTDADWSTRFTWNRTNEDTSEGEVNFFTVIFDFIADATGFEFDISEALKLYEKKNWVEDVFGSANGETHWNERKKKIKDRLFELQLLRNNPRKEPRRESSDESTVIIDWEIPVEQQAGIYRIKYLGDYKDQNNKTHAFEGVSSTFTLQS